MPKTDPTNPTPKKERRKWKPKFLEALRTAPSVSVAAAAAGINRSTAYDARKVDEAFAANWDEAIEHSIDAAEAELFRRAVQGVRKPATVAGRRVEITEYSDTLLIFLLKSHRPERYRDTTRSLNLNLTPEQLANLPDDELDRLINSLAR